MSKKALLMILDGWGLGDHGKDDVIFNTATPYWDYLMETYPHSQLQASGENVGLPDGQMGNSEVGHLNIGAGRVVYQDLVKINLSCRDNSILKNPEIVSAFSYAKENGKNVHFMGLTSDGGVHSSLDHLFKLCDIAKEYNIENTFVHCFMDGRDTDPKSGKGFIEQLEAHCAKSAGKVASIIGRYYAMDRDKRWERVKEAYDLLVNGIGKKATDMVQAMQESYDEGVTDEFIKPIVNAGVDGTIREGDVVIFFNYRNDRAKELTVVLTQQDMPEAGMHTIPGLQYYCMTPYDASFKGVHILFDKENVANTLGEYVAANGSFKATADSTTVAKDIAGKGTGYLKNGTYAAYSTTGTAPVIAKSSDTTTDIETGYVTIDATQATSVTGLTSTVTVTTGNVAYNKATVKITAAKADVTKDYTITVMNGSDVVKTFTAKAGADIDETVSLGDLTANVAASAITVKADEIKATHSISYPTAVTSNGVTMTVTGPATAKEGETVTAKASFSGTAAGATTFTVGNVTPTWDATLPSGMTASSTTVTIADGTAYLTAVEVLFTFTMGSSNVTITLA